MSNVVGCNSGTAALHLAIEALRLPQGSQVIVPDYAMVACARAVSLAGLTPAFADVLEQDYNLDPKSVEDNILAINRNGKRCWRLASDPPVSAIMAVHTYGRPCNMAAICELAAKYNIAVIEDLAESHCTYPYPESDAACWSFYRNKVVFGEEGGAVAFHHDLNAEYQYAKSLRCIGFDNNHDYWHNPRGHNYRLSNCNAEAILTNMRQMDSWVRLRLDQSAIYNHVLGTTYPSSSRETPWVYDLRIKGMDPCEQRMIVERLRAYGIGARYGFKPLSLQPEYSYISDRGELERQILLTATTAARLSRDVLYLPLGQNITMPVDKMAELVLGTLDDVLHP
jgi:dTDP-4-amino-4,6-dideoxygalactose transaminase